MNLSLTGEAAVFQIDPLSNDGNYGINLYCSVKSMEGENWLLSRDGL